MKFLVLGNGKLKAIIFIQIFIINLEKQSLLSLDSPMKLLSIHSFSKFSLSAQHVPSTIMLTLEGPLLGMEGKQHREKWGPKRSQQTDGGPVIPPNIKQQLEVVSSLPPGDTDMSEGQTMYQGEWGNLEAANSETAFSYV